MQRDVLSSPSNPISTTLVPDQPPPTFRLRTLSLYPASSTSEPQTSEEHAHELQAQERLLA